MLHTDFFELNHSSQKERMVPGSILFWGIPLATSLSLSARNISASLRVPNARENHFCFPVDKPGMTPTLFRLCRQRFFIPIVDKPVLENQVPTQRRTLRSSPSERFSSTLLIDIEI